MKKVVIVSSAFILVVIFFLFDWIEKPKEWILGEWYEPSYKVKVVVMPNRITLTSEWSPRRMYVFGYEILEDSEEIVAWREEYPETRYKGIFQFSGKKKLQITPQPETVKSLRIGYRENLSTNWQKMEAK